MDFTIERKLKKVFAYFGISISHYSLTSSRNLRLVKMINHNRISLVLDVGAGEGQYALGLIDNGYQGEVMSFEPLSEHYKHLTKRAAKYPKWHIASKCVIGDKRDQTRINVTENLVSSTLLTMKNSHIEGSKESKVVGQEDVQMYTLDEMIANRLTDDERIFLKMDVQGFEQEVLNGARHSLPFVHGIDIEFAMTPLYEENNLFMDDVMKMMKDMGYELWEISPAFIDENTGKVLQCNGVFFKE